MMEKTERVIWKGNKECRFWKDMFEKVVLIQKKSSNLYFVGF